MGNDLAQVRRAYPAEAGMSNCIAAIITDGHKVQVKKSFRAFNDERGGIRTVLSNLNTILYI